jgi:hypothetical protein
MLAVRLEAHVALLPLPRRGSGHGSLESIAYRAHSARTAEPVHLAANA